MTTSERNARDEADDLGDYCRRVEAHLARVNGGHMVRVVGPAFDLVRAWFRIEIPLSVVRRGIERKAERHKAGRSTRALRLEFCEPDVIDEHRLWRRAVGLRPSEPVEPAAPAVEGATGRSASKQIERAMAKLAQLAGRLDLPDQARDEASSLLDALAALRDDSRRMRGEARAALLPRAAAVDVKVGELARLLSAEAAVQAEAEAMDELAAFRSRLPVEAWLRAVRVAADRILRERLGLPTLDIQPAD